MFNLLCMDLRRLIRSRSFRIVLGVMAGLILLVNLLVAVTSDEAFLDEMAVGGAEIDELDRRYSEEIRGMSQLALAHECLGSGFLLIMTGIGMTFFTGSDFTTGYIKNICCARPRRSGYVLSKIILAGIYSGIITVLAVLLSLLSPVLFQLYPKADSVFSILQYAFWLWLPHWAFALMALALVLLSRNIGLGIILSMVSGGGLLAVLLNTLGKALGWPPFERYFLSSVVKGYCVPQTDMWMVILLCAAGWAAVYGAGSVLAMKKQDI